MIEHLRGREKALEKLGLTPRHAEWVALVALHSGLFLRSQYARFLRDSGSGSRVRALRLVEALTGHGLARDVQLPGIGRVCLVHSKTIYRLLRVPHIRHRREAGRGIMLRRLLSLDCVVGREALPWLPTEPEKVAAFAELGIERRILPKRVYGGPGRGRTVRYFGWKMPVAFDGRVALFVHVDVGAETHAELLSWGAQHFSLWSALAERGIRIEAAVASAAADRLAGARRVLDRWLSGGLGESHSLSPAERSELQRIERAASAVDLDELERLGGFEAALDRAAQLQAKAASERGGRRVRLDSARTWLAGLPSVGVSP